MNVARILAALAITAAAGAQQLPFRVEMTPAKLSNHQRLQASIIVRIDGKEISKRNGEGLLETEIEIVDRKGVRYRSRGTSEIKGLTPEGKRPDIVYVLDFFALPGNYTAYVSVGDTASNEGGAARHAFFVPPLPNDPLPRAWRDLPPIEFLAAADPPEKWFQPGLNGRLHLPVKTSRPVKIDLLVHITPTEAMGVNGRINDLNLATLLPALKAMADMDPIEGNMTISVLDSTRRKIIFSQGVVADINWTGLSDALRAADPHVVDVKSLANREQRAEFFLSEVTRRVEEAGQPEEPPHILIVLSGPMVFGEKVSLHPIATTGNENCKVFYIRYAWGLVHPAVSSSARGVAIVNAPARQPSITTSAGGRGVRPPETVPVLVETLPVNPQPNPEEDTLEATLKPLKPRLFHVESPIAFRRALSELIADISKQ